MHLIGGGSMSDLFYTGLGKKVFRPGNVSRPINKVSFIGEKRIDFDMYTEKDIVSGYCNDLMHLLEEEDIRVMISGIFQIQSQLSHLNEERGEIVFPTLDEFFKGLSPILLQVVWENLEENPDLSKMLKKWKEAIRIALEEELYIWQEKF